MPINAIDAPEPISSRDLPNNHSSRQKPEDDDPCPASIEAHTARLTEIAKSLRDGEAVPPVTVRSFLSWFWHSQRRGHWIVSYIRDQLRENGLTTSPDFESTYLDAEIRFRLVEHFIQDAKAPSEVTPPITETIDDSQNLIFKSSQADPTYRISKLAASNRVPLRINPDAPLQEAVTLMLSNDFSQLPVMTNDRDVRGSVSWRSIGTRLALKQSPSVVREAMEPYAEVNSDASLFTVIPVIVEHEYALVRGDDKRIVGIITTSDLSLQFQQLSEPFLLLGEIENHMRRLIGARFSVSEIEEAKDPTDSERKIQAVSDLTFGEYKRLLENPEMWSKLRLQLDRSIFIKLLECIRKIRNDVMHFDPDGIEESDLTVLRDFVKFLRNLHIIGAT
jgi:predicted transcriptional regulator